MKMATSERQGRVRARDGICGPFGAVTDGEVGQEAGRWVNIFMSFANTIRRRSSEISATSSPNAILGLPRK